MANERITKEQFMEMQEELVEGYKQEDFQRKLHAGWHSTTEQVEKLTWKNGVCLEVQGPILARYGFEASRRGVSQTLKTYFRRFHGDRQILRYNEVLAWLVDPDLQAMEPDGPGGSLTLANGPLGSMTSYSKEVMACYGRTNIESPFVGHWAFGEQPHERFQICMADNSWFRVELLLTSGWPARGFFYTKFGEAPGDPAFAELRHTEGDSQDVVTAMRMKLAAPGYMVVNFLVEPGECDESPSWSQDLVARRSCGCTVRVTSADEAAALGGVERVQGALAGAHQALYKPLYPELEQEQWFRVLGCDSIQESLECGVLILHAEMDDGQVVGYISCACCYGSPGQDAAAEDDEENDEDKPHAKINHISVLPDHRGRGIGRMLLEELLLHLRTASPSVARDLRLRVVENNAFAIAWYERLGFAESCRIDATCGCCPVVFVEMRRSDDVPLVS